MTETIWKDIPGYNGKYQVNIDGEIRRNDYYSTNGHLRKGKMMNVRRGGCTLYFNGETHYINVKDVLKDVFDKETIEMSANEEWKDIIGFSGKYQISNLGRVLRKEYVSLSGRVIRENVVKQRNGMVVLIDNNGIHTTVSVQSLLLDYFGLGDVEDLESEEWRDIKGFEGKFQVSNLGRVKRLDHTTLTKNGKLQRNLPKLVTHDVGPFGYHRVELGGKKYLVSRLVGEAFIPNPNNYPHIDHINTDKSDNSATNLRWCTPSMNMNNPLTRRNMEISHKNNMHITVYCDGNEVAKFCNISDLSRKAFDILGVKMSRRKISEAIKSGNEYKGYTISRY